MARLRANTGIFIRHDFGDKARLFLEVSDRIGGSGDFHFGSLLREFPRAKITGRLLAPQMQPERFSDNYADDIFIFLAGRAAKSRAVRIVATI